MATSITGRSILAPRAAELVQRVQSRARPVEIIYRSHDLWPLPPLPLIPDVPSSERSSSADHPAESQLESGAPANASARASRTSSSQGHGAHPPHRPIRISVLDSSFNPPTLAHLSLIRSLPPPLDGRDCNPNISSDRESPGGSLPEEEEVVTKDYDARLLMLSVRNADKSLKPGDATYTQRLEMMVRLARVFQDEACSPYASAAENVANVAVAIIDEPTFINKSSVLRSFLEEHLTKLEKGGEISVPAETQRIQLTFLMGYDTLERFFAPRYYAPSSSGEDAERIMLAMLDKYFAAPSVGDGSRVVCAYRSSVSSVDSGTKDTDTTAQGKTMVLARRFEADGLVSFLTLSDSVAAISSSEVRARIAKGDDWKHMVAHQVAAYVEEQSLYLAKSEAVE